MAALWRKRRLDELRAQEVAVLEAAFENDLIAEDRFVIVRVTEELLAAAARAVARHPLRAYDGVQLASALAARAADPDLRRFACFDERLARAAAAEGFQVVSG